MAPEDKREHESDQQTETEKVVKKIKDEIGGKPVAVQEAAKKVGGEEAKAKQEPHKNSKDVDKNGSKVATESGDGHEKSQVNGSKNGDDQESEPQAAVGQESNGNVKKDTAATTKPVQDKNQQKRTASPAAAAAKTTAPEPPTPPKDEPAGTLLICGGANWDMTGRKELPKNAKKPVEVDPASRNLWGPHRVCLDGASGDPLRVRGVFSGCNACHSVIVTDDGVAMTFGRNDKGQLGVGDTETRTLPTVVEALKGIDVVAAACGRSHTLFLDSNGIVYACGDNKMGQCGTNQQSVQQLTTPARIAFKENKPVLRMACGAEFSMIVDIDGRLYSFGHPEHGQLGHNSEGKYFTTGNKYAFHCEYAPRRIVTFIEKSREGHVSPADDVVITDVACGTNHTLAVDKKNRCFSWGFAGYHRLGHSETKNELVPRSIKVFDAPNNSGRGATRVFAGATHSMALDVNGLLYFWGQNKSSGEATMYPKNVQDLCGWRIKLVSCANRSIFVVADDTCISWGPSPTYGELGYGEGKSKSSTVPQEVKPLDGVSIKSVACGFGHTLLIARDSSAEDQTSLKKFKNWP